MTNAEILERLRKVRILVIGDCMVDHYIYGDVNRVSPEAPVPVVHVVREHHTAGGAANVALNLVALGAQSEVIGCVGDDAMGRRLTQSLDSADVETKRFYKSNAPTIVKTRVVARTQQVCRIDYELERAKYALTNRDGFRETIRSAMKESDAVIISDYAKGVVSQELMNVVLRAGLELGVMISVDPKPIRQINIRGASLLTPNRSEALELAGMEEPGSGVEYPLDEVIGRIHDRYAPAMLVVTLGAEGMAVSRLGEKTSILPTAAREVFDVSGAGDTVIACLTGTLAAGGDLETAARFANDAAGLVVAKTGTATVTADELR